MKRSIVGLVGIASVALGALLLGGCGSPGSVGTGSVGNGPGGSAGAPSVKLDGSPAGMAGAGGSGTSGSLPTADTNCGSVTSETTRQPADVLLVLDRSSSMNYSTSADSNCNGGSSCTARWPALTSAVNSTLASTSGSINWGLKLFASPSGGACGVTSGVEVAISSTSVAAIQSQISSISPGNNTPTAQAIEAATGYLKTVSDTHGKYILLATDGEPNCAPGGSNTSKNVQGTVDAISAAKAAGFPVWVIGIGPSVGNLDNFAAAGGTNNYYPATSPQALSDAFASIGTIVAATCTFTSNQAPPDPDNIAVYLNKKLVAKDPVNGWSFGPSALVVVLNGSSCAEATSGNETVQILFGCPNGPPPPMVIP
jgi:von Willebrand factor type A domain